jgi:hypothetical protein
VEKTEPTFLTFWTCLLVASVETILFEREGQMSRQRGLIQRSLAGALLLGLLVGVCLIVWKRFLKPDPSEAIVKHTVDTNPDDVLKYWTEERMRNAKPAKMPHVPDQDRGKPHPRRPSRESRPENS